jgi:hypothetical protein
VVPEKTAAGLSSQEGCRFDPLIRQRGRELLKCRTDWLRCLSFDAVSLVRTSRRYLGGGEPPLFDGVMVRRATRTPCVTAGAESGRPYWSSDLALTLPLTRSTGPGRGARGRLHPLNGDRYLLHALSRALTHRRLQGELRTAGSAADRKLGGFTVGRFFGEPRRRPNVTCGRATWQGS